MSLLQKSCRTLEGAAKVRLKCVRVKPIKIAGTIDTGHNNKASLPNSTRSISNLKINYSTKVVHSNISSSKILNRVGNPFH